MVVLPHLSCGRPCPRLDPRVVLLLVLWDVRTKRCLKRKSASFSWWVELILGTNREIGWVADWVNGPWGEGEGG